MPDEIEADDLRTLLASAAWQWFWQEAQREWGPAGYGRKMQAALASVPSGPDRAFELARVAEAVDAQAQAVNALMSRPQAELSRLTQKTKPRPFEGFRRTLRTGG